jgi:hypothetical protein
MSAMLGGDDDFADGGDTMHAAPLDGQSKDKLAAELPT